MVIRTAQQVSCGKPFIVAISAPNLNSAKQIVAHSLLLGFFKAPDFLEVTITD